MSIIYEKNNEDYHGGYRLESFIEQQYENKYNYLGGNHQTTHSRFNHMVIPFGLFYRNPSMNLEESEINTPFDNEETEIYEQESQCIEPKIFDHLIYAVSEIEIPKQRKNKNKTRKLKRYTVQREK